MCGGPKTSKDSLVLFLGGLVGLKSKMSYKSAKEKAKECEPLLVFERTGITLGCFRQLSGRFSRTWKMVKGFSHQT